MVHDRFLLKSAVGDYESGRIDKARKKFLEIAEQSGSVEPEIFEFLYLIASHEEPRDLVAAETWRKRFVDLVRQLAEQGSVKWQLRLACMSQFGDRVPVDPLYARETMRKLANAGIAEAQYHLASVYRHGHCGLEADEAQYVQWLEIAAGNKWPAAQYEFALLLLAGENPERSRASLLLRESAHAGFGLAKAALDQLQKS